MGLRGKLRQTFSSSSKKSASTSSASSKNNKNNTNTTSNTPIYPNETHYTDRTDIEYYKPNEIPKSKYRGKVDPAHHASLGAFSLSDAFAATTRRASLALSGTFSPGGTKSQSRVPSRVPSRRPSVAAVPEAGSNLRMEERAGSGGSEATRERSEDSNNTSSSAGASAGEGAGSDTASTSLSGPTSTKGTTAPTTAVAPTPMTTLTSPSNPKLVGVSSDGGLDTDVASSTVLSKQITAHDTPFTAEELEMAMTRATFRDRDGVVHEVHVA